MRKVTRTAVTQDASNLESSAGQIASTAEETEPVVVADLSNERHGPPWNARVRHICGRQYVAFRRSPPALSSGQGAYKSSVSFWHESLQCRLQVAVEEAISLESPSGVQA